MADSRVEELKRRVQLDPASIAFAALAEEYRRLGQYQEAIDTCKAGLQRHPSYISAHVTLGRALLEVGQYDEAREELEYVLRVAPENLAAIRGLAEIHHRRGDLPDGGESFDFDTTHYAEAAAAPEPPRVAAAPVTPDIPVRAPQPIRVSSAEPADQRVLTELEQFLAAIQRARYGSHASSPS